MFRGLTIPSVVGPFAYFDARAYLSQQLFDWKGINKTRSATESLKTAEYNYKDARDLVVLAVGYVYLQAIADEARIETAAAQVKTAQALYDQAHDQFNAGTSPSIDALRAKVELQTRQQQLIQAKNDFAIQKLTVARVIGLAPGQQFELTDKSPYSPLEGVTVDEALARAYAGRSDYQAALSDVRAMEYSRKAASAGYFPSFLLSTLITAWPGRTSRHESWRVRCARNAEYPDISGRQRPRRRVEGGCATQQSRERWKICAAQIDTDVRTALFNLESSARAGEVARSNIDLAEETLRNRSTALLQASPIPWKWCNRRKPLPARTNGTFRACTASTMQRFHLARAVGHGRRRRERIFQRKIAMAQRTEVDIPLNPPPTKNRLRRRLTKPTRQLLRRPTTRKISPQWPAARMLAIGAVLVLLVGGFFGWRYFTSYEITDDAQVDGHLMPLSTRISGYVTKVNVDDNQYVKAGYVLAEIDPRDYQVAVDQARAERG